MSTEEKEHIKKAIGNAIIIFTLGIMVALVAGIIKGSFFAPEEANKIQITKSPLQIVYSGNSKENVIDIVKEIKDIPFHDYLFNPTTNISINSQDVKTQNTSDVIKTDINTDINTNIKHKLSPKEENAIK